MGAFSSLARSQQVLAVQAPAGPASWGTFRGAFIHLIHNLISLRPLRFSHTFLPWSLEEARLFPKIARYGPPTSLADFSRFLMAQFPKPSVLLHRMLAIRAWAKMSKKEGLLSHSSGQGCWDTLIRLRAPNRRVQRLCPCLVGRRMAHLGHIRRTRLHQGPFRFLCHTRAQNVVGACQRAVSGAERVMRKATRTRLWLTRLATMRRKAGM